MESTLEEKKQEEIVEEIDDEPKLSPSNQPTILFEHMDVVDELVSQVMICLRSIFFSN